jgi:hypothetical protein
MSKKRLHNRLENLFSDLAGDGNLPPDEVPTVPEPDAPVDAQRSLPVEQPAPASTVPAFLASWNWEIDENYQYVNCGLEVSDSLRMNPRNFLGQSILTYALHESSRESLEAVLKGDVFPTEITVLFEPKPGEILPARVNVLSKIEAGGRVIGWRGISQRLPDDSKHIEKSKRTPAAPSQRETGGGPVLPLSSPRIGYAL